MLSSLILCNNNEPFLERIVTCDKWILYDNQQWPAQWLDWEEAPKHFPKPNLHQEKVIVTGGLLPIWSTTAFWILVKPLYLRSMLSRSMRCISNYNTCRWRWSTEWAQFFSMTIPMHMSHNQKVLVVWHTASKVEQIGLQSFASSTIFTWPPTNQLPLLQASWQLFSGRTLPQPEGGRKKKCFPRVYWILKHGFFTTGINKLISHWQKCVDCNGPYFD